MAKKRNSNYKLLILIIICLIMSIASLCFLIVLLKDKTKSTQTENNNAVVDTRERDTAYERPDIISPMQKEKLFNEYSQINEKSVLESLTKFVYYITDNKAQISNMSDEKIEEEYNLKYNDFKQMGITNKTYYNYIINILKNINKDELELSYTQFDVSTIEKIENGITIKFNIKYVDVDEIGLNLVIKNNEIEFVE